MRLLRLIQGVFSFVYVSLIVFTVPLAFDVGGEDCGIAFTFTLSGFYLVMSTLRIVTRRTRLSVIGSSLYYLQHLVIPALLILHLGLFSPPEEPSPIWLKVIHPWRLFVKMSTPLFTILEGFCTLLVIQATGQISKWMIRRSDTYMLMQIFVAGITLTTSLYFLYRIYTFPVVIDLVNATLIGAVLTVSSCLGIYGIVSGRGTAIESSMLFSYIVYCLYVTFTDFKATITLSSMMSFFTKESPPPPRITTPAVVAAVSTTSLGLFSSLLVKAGLASSPSPPPSPSPSPIQQFMPPASIPPLPPVIIDSFTNVVSLIARLTPQGFVAVWELFLGAASTMAPSVLFTLVFRMTVFYAATRIIPALRDNTTTRPYSKSKPALFVVHAYAPCILIAVYTHLLMQNSGLLKQTHATDGISDPSGLWWVLGNSQEAIQFWGWTNMFLTLILYGLELMYGQSNQVFIDNHFKSA